MKKIIILSVFSFLLFTACSERSNVVEIIDDAGYKYLEIDAQLGFGFEDKRVCDYEVKYDQITNGYFLTWEVKSGKVLSKHTVFFSRKPLLTSLDTEKKAFRVVFETPWDRLSSEERAEAIKKEKI